MISNNASRGNTNDDIGEESFGTNMHDESEQNSPKDQNSGNNNNKQDNNISAIVVDHGPGSSSNSHGQHQDQYSTTNLVNNQYDVYYTGNNSAAVTAASGANSPSLVTISSGQLINGHGTPVVQYAAPQHHVHYFIYFVC